MCHANTYICLFSLNSMFKCANEAVFCTRNPVQLLCKTSYFDLVLCYMMRNSLLITTVLFKIQIFKFQTAKRPPEVRVPDLPENFPGTLESK